MPKVIEISNFLEKLAPKSMKMDFDNVGLLVGKSQTQVARILVSLDITDEVISEAEALGAGLIVAHHPLFFGIKAVTDEDRIGRKIIRLLESGISAICMHTNLDAAKGGVNDALAKAIGLLDIATLHPAGVDGDGFDYGLGRIGQLAADTSLVSFMETVKSALKTAALRYHDAKRPVKKVAVLGGSGGDHLKYALAAGCDTFLTADVKYDVFLAAKEEGIHLIDGDHFCTENVISPILAEKLQQAFPEAAVTISKVHRQTAQFF